MRSHNRFALMLVPVLLIGCGGSGWRPEPAPPAQREAVQRDDVTETIARFQEEDPDITAFFEQAHAFAIFPNVGKGGIGVGGAHGHGYVYERGHLVGTTKLTQVTLGFQLGGQAYSEVIFFQDENAFRDFAEGNFELGAQASAIAVTAGASADASYDRGVAIFTLPKGGLMYEATVGGQKFSYQSLR